MNKLIGIGLNADWIDGDDRKLRYCLELARKSGGNCCELIMHSMDVLLNGRLLEPRVSAVKHILMDYDFTYSIHMPYSFHSLSMGEVESIAFFRSCIDFAKEIRAQNITVHASPIGVEDEDSLLKDIDYYKEIAQYAGGIRIGIENPYYSGDIEKFRTMLGVNPENLAAHIKRIGCDNCGITLDFGHAYLSAINYDRDYVSDIRKMASLAVHLHVHDNFGKHGEMKNYMDNFSKGIGDLHLPPAWGEIPWGSVLPLLEGFSGIHILEMEFRFYQYFHAGVKFLNDAAKTQEVNCL
ncbi:sugar phosphate isomerase/epimerase family protein [Lacrimispora indolis]|uniref:sugar phosphate isomerase/epimerase family protein n=1 Tax=Lacrimispora indolis TaxID=69825 RepID=UPI00045E6847|nr:sugar phosphate isomerase/epimerase [Lacrimispora indolis]